MSGCDSCIYNTKANIKFIKERQLLNTKSDSKRQEHEMYNGGESGGEEGEDYAWRYEMGKVAI